MRHSKVIYLSIFAILLAYSYALSATRNVPGTYATIQAAHDAAVSGDTILVADGTYKETVTISKSNLTFQSTNKHGAVIDGQKVRDFGFTTTTANIDNVTIDGFEIKNMNDTGINHNAGTANFDNWVIKNNKVHHIWQWGIKPRGTGIEVANNEIYMVGNAQESMGIKIECNTCSIHDNQVYAVAKNAIRSSRWDNDIYNNIVFYSAVCIAYNTAEGSQSGGGIIANNWLYDCESGYKPKHNQCTTGRNNAYEWFYHNTIHNNAHTMVDIGVNEPTTHCIRIKNNVFSQGFGNGRAAVAERDEPERTFNIDIDGNLYDTNQALWWSTFSNPTVEYNTLTELQNNKGYENNGIVGDAQITDYQSGSNYAPGSIVFNGSLNLPTAYGTQLGAHGLTQVNQKIDYLNNVQAISASAATGTLNRLTDFNDDTRWLPGTTSGNVVLNLNNGQDATFEVFSYWGYVKSNGNIESFILQKGESASGPWTTIISEVGDNTDTLGGWALFEPCAPVTTKFVRFQWNSVYENDPMIISQIVFFNFNDIGEQPPEPNGPPPPSPDTPDYGPDLEETCHTTQDPSTSSLIIVPDDVQDPELAVENNTDATILIKPATYNVNDFVVGADNVVLPYNCGNVGIKPQSSSPAAITSNNWTIEGIQFKCDNVPSTAACLSVGGTASGWTIKNNWIDNAKSGLDITANATNGSVIGNLIEGPPGAGLPNYLIHLGDTDRLNNTISSVTVEENQLRGNTGGNSTPGNSMMYAEGLSGLGVVVEDNLFTNPHNYGQALYVRKNYQAAGDASNGALTFRYNKVIGPFTGNADQNGPARGTVWDDDLNCKTNDDCPPHAFHHNYFVNSYSQNAGSNGGFLATMLLFSLTNYTSGTFEFNIDHNFTNTFVDNTASKFHNVTFRHNTWRYGHLGFSGTACTDTNTLTIDNDAFYQTSINDACTGATNWTITNNVFSDVVSGGFDPTHQGAGNSTDSITLADMSTTTPDLTIQTTAHASKGALSVPSVTSAAIDDSCVLSIVMAPYNDIYNHGTISEFTPSKVTVQYDSVTQTQSGAAGPFTVSSNTLNINMASCPGASDVVTFDATYGWCYDSANVGSRLEDPLNAGCLAVSGQSVTNNTTGSTGVFYVDASCGTNGDGTSETCGAGGPWNSLKAALETAACSGMSPGDTLEVKGDAAQDLTCDTGTDCYGDEDIDVAAGCNGIVIQNTATEHAVLNGSTDVSGLTWVSIGSGVYQCTTSGCGGTIGDAFPSRAYYDHGAGEAELALIQSNSTCDTSLAAGFMKVDTTDMSICAHLDDGSNPAAAAYFKVPTKNALIIAGSSSSQNITLQNNPSGGSIAVVRYRSHGILLDPTKHTGWTVKGLEFADIMDTCLGITGAPATTVDTKFINNTATFCGQKGISVVGDLGSFEVTGNTITDIQTEPFYEQCTGSCLSGFGIDGTAIYLANQNGSGGTITNNTILRVGGGYQNIAYGIALIGYNNNHLIEANYIAHLSGLSYGYGIYMTGTAPSAFNDNNRMFNNRIYDIDIGYSQNYSSTFGTQTGRRNHFVNNTIAEPILYGMIAEGNGNQNGGLNVINNVFVSQSNSPTFIYVPLGDTDGWDTIAHNAFECDGCNFDQDIIDYQFVAEPQPSGEEGDEAQNEVRRVERPEDCDAGIDCIEGFNGIGGAHTAGELHGVHGNLYGNIEVVLTGTEPTLQITGTSVAFDAGVFHQGVDVDYLDTTRPDATANDMGAHEFISTGGSLFAFTQDAFQFFGKFLGDGVKPLVTENMNINVYSRSFFTLRFSVVAENGDAPARNFNLYARKCTPSCGAWTLVDTSDSATVGVYIADNPERLNRSSISNALSLDARTFLTDESLFIDADNSSITAIVTQDAQVEIEFSLGISSGASLDDTIELRMELDDGTDFETYSNTPSIAVVNVRSTIIGGINQ